MKLARYKRVCLIVFLYIGIAGWLLLTNPQDMSIVFLIVPFILLFFALWFSADVVIRRFFSGLSRSRRLTVKLCVSVVPVFLLVLNSVNQLTWRDIILAILLVAFLIFYSGRIHFSKP